MISGRAGWIAVGVIFCYCSGGLAGGSAKCGLRPGVHGAGGCADPLPLEVEGVRSVRFILEHTAISEIVASPQGLEKFQAFLDPFADQCVDVVITVRIVDPANDEFDYIPDTPDQVAILSELFAFFATFGADIDACQIGNEIFGGPGTYRIGGRTAEEWSDANFDALSVWLAAIAATVTDGAASSSASVGLISPALTPGLTRRGAAGLWQGGVCGPEPTCPTITCPTPCYAPNALATRLVDFVIAFGNEYCDMIDQHLHVSCLDEIENVINLLQQNPCGLLAVSPKRLTTLEWSSAHAGRRWLAEPSLTLPGFTNEDEMLSFLERVEWCDLEPSCGLCDPVQPSEWDDFMQQFDAWFIDDSGLDVAGFVAGALDLMEAAGFEHACYSTLSQQGIQSADRLNMVRQCEDVLPAIAGDVYIFDVTALRADETVGAADVCEAVWSSVFLDAVEAGFAPYALRQCPLVPADQNCDGHVDSIDDACWLGCLAGPEVAAPYACRRADLDGDLDADLNDYALLQRLPRE